MSKHLIYGTHNPSKVAQVQHALKDLDITVEGLGDVDSEVEEDGKTPEENARKKALTYAKITGSDVLSMDTALYFEGLPDHMQPGLHVRRIPGYHYASDEEALDYYSELITNHGGKLLGYWEFSFALSSPDGRVESFTSRTASRIFINTPHPTVLPGYPLTSLQVETNGQYVLDAQNQETDLWQQASLGDPLIDFIKKHYTA